MEQDPPPIVALMIVDAVLVTYLVVGLMLRFEMSPRSRLDSRTRMHRRIRDRTDTTPGTVDVTVTSAVS